VLFDLDGVLVDSRAPITGCINHALVTHGLGPRPAAELLKFIGPPLSLGFAELTGEAADSALVSACVSAYRERYGVVSLRETAVVPGMEHVLAKLARRHRLAVATSKPLVYAEPLLEALGLRHFFDFCAGPELSASGEDKSVTIAEALARIDCATAIMVGDRSLDIVGAHRCAVAAIAVTWGIGTIEELESAHPDGIAELPEELPTVIAELLVDRHIHPLKI
jgi:phosphoglycolate phosphatase